MRLRAYLPTTTPGVNGIDLGPDTSSFPGWGVMMPSVLGFSPDGQRMYGIEASTGAFLTYFLVSSSPPTITALGLTNPAGIAVTPDGLKAYVGLIGGNVAVVDLSGPTPSVVATIPTSALTHIVMTSQGDWVYATAAAGDLLRIDTTTDVVVQSIPLGAGITPKGLDITPDGLRAAVSAMHSGGMGLVLLVNLPTGAAPMTAINLGGDPRNIVITPDGTTALLADYTGRVLFIDLATGGVSDSHTNLTPLNALGSIDVEPSGRYAWFFDSGTHNLFRLDLITRTSGVLTSSPNSPDINGKFIGKSVFFFAGPADAVSSDAELTTMGFGREVIIEGGVTEVHLAAGFTSDRTFRFNATGVNNPELGVTGQVTLTGILRGSGFNLTGTGILTTTGNYQIGPTTVANATLLVEGTHNGEIQLDSGGVLRGTGAVGDLNVKPGGSVRPGGGAGVGRLTSGATFFESGSTLLIDIQGTTAASGYDHNW